MTPCPRCAHRSHRVSKATVASHTQPVSWAAVQHTDHWFFCAQRECEVGYFAEGAPVVTVAQMTTLPFSKGDALARRVCFCFGHTVAAVLADRGSREESPIKQAITEACGNGEANCERYNPAGRCCLGQIALLLRDSTVAPENPLDSQPCCGPKESGQAPQAQAKGAATPTVPAGPRGGQ